MSTTEDADLDLKDHRGSCHSEYILISEYLTPTSQGSGLSNLKCPHDIDGVEKNSQFSYRQRMIRLIYLRALSHRAIHDATQVENHFPTVTSDLYLCYS